MYLKNRANKDGACFPAVGTIAKDLNLSKRTVYRALDELERKEYVKRTARWREKGGRSSTSYQIA